MTIRSSPRSGRRKRDRSNLGWAWYVQPDRRDEATWIEFLNAIGTEQGLVSYGVPEFPGTERICTAFCSDPDRFPGLLHILASLVLAGNKCAVPREIVERCTGWDDSSKTSALLLAIARNDLDAAEIETLAQRLLENQNSLYAVWCALQLSQRHFPLERSASLALAFMKLLASRGNWSARTMNELVTVLTDYLTKRPSSLDDAAEWQRLRLPQRV